MTKKTIFFVSDMSAMGIRLELDVKTIEQEGSYPNSPKTHYKIIGVPRGKRKPVRLTTHIKDCAIIDGWDIPLMLDNEKKEGMVKFSGNCCLNFLSEPEQIKAVFDKNENPDFNKGIIIHVVQAGREDGDKETPVYFEEARELAPHSAPLQAIMERGEKHYIRGD